MNLKDKKICIIGLGYVGLPLGVAFAEKFKVIGYDTNKSRSPSLSISAIAIGPTPDATEL